ncbi:MAG: hypothetical protein AAF628_35860 [Planctomycetota bacterium]
MPGLFTAKAVAVLAHCLHHGSITDRRGVDTDAMFGEALLEAQVAHDRRHDGVARELAAFAQRGS